MKHENKPTYSFVILTIGLIIITTILARYVAFPSPLTPGMSTIYPAVAFMILFALWFGGYGVIAAYAGGFIGAGILVNIPAEVAVYWALADLFQVLIPLLAVRKFRINLDLRTRRDLIMMVIFGVIVNNLIGAAWGASTLAVGGVIAWSAVSSTFVGWFVANVILSAVIVLPLLHFVTPVVAKSRLFVRHYWN